MDCPRGCDANMEYVGIDDGFGEYGNMTCDLYECPICGEQMTGDCLPSSLYHAIEDHSDPEYFMECSMCGKETSRRECGMCTNCEQVWRG